MYLDHLNFNNNNATAAVESVSFMDCMEAALSCTEVHSSAAAYLIKAEAEYLAMGSEGEALEGFWAKIKTVIRKLWETVKNLATKVYIFVTGIPAKIGRAFAKLSIAHKADNIKQDFNAAKKGAKIDEAERKGVKFLDLNKFGAQLQQLTPYDGAELDVREGAKGIDAERKKNASLRTKIKEAVGNKNSAVWFSVKKLDDSIINDAFSAIKGKGVSGIVDKMLKQFADGSKKVQSDADKIAKGYDAAYKAKDQEKVKQITKALSAARSALIENATNANFVASLVFKQVSSVLSAIRATIGAYKKEEKEEKK